MKKLTLMRFPIISAKAYCGKPHQQRQAKCYFSPFMQKKCKRSLFLASVLLNK